MCFWSISLFCSLAQDLCAQNCALEAKAVVSKHLRQHCTLQAALLGLMLKDVERIFCDMHIDHYTTIFQHILAQLEDISACYFDSCITAIDSHSHHGVMCR